MGVGVAAGCAAASATETADVRAGAASGDGLLAPGKSGKRSTAAVSGSKRGGPSGRSVGTLSATHGRKGLSTELVKVPGLLPGVLLPMNHSSLNGNWIGLCQQRTSAGKNTIGPPRPPCATNSKYVQLNAHSPDFNRLKARINARLNALPLSFLLYSEARTTADGYVPGSLRIEASTKASAAVIALA